MTPARFILGFAGTIALVGGAFGIANAASATEPEVEDGTPYVLALWLSDTEHPDLWPQSLLATADLAEADFAALDSEFPECGIVQVDLYWDNDVTAALIAGGVLYGPGNPPEALAYVLESGDPWKVVDLGECIVEEPPVEEPPVVVPPPVNPPPVTEPAALASTGLEQGPHMLLAAGLMLAGAATLAALRLTGRRRG